jgi:rod shape determining protein RodA
MTTTSPFVLPLRDSALRDPAHDRGSPLRRIDWILLAAVLGLIVLGSLLVWSATRYRMIDEGLDPQAYLKRHLINAVIGLVLGAIAAMVDYRSLRAYAPFVYAASCAGLLAVLAIGSTINGAHTRIVLGGGFQVQPSEFAKVALVVGMAMMLGEKRDGEDAPRSSDIMLVLALAAVPMALIMLQPDFGTTMVFVFVIFGVLAISGAPTKWLVGLFVAGVVVAAGAVHLGVLHDYQLNRFRVVADPTADPRGAGYNVEQARIAVGSGGWLGKGLFEGTQTSGKFVPEQQTDFVFTVAGEELGFAGAGAILLLLGLVLWRGLHIAANAADDFGRLVAAGVVCWFSFQSFVNVGMTLGIMPVTGLPLPFVSYGGSSMFAALIAVGLLLNVHARSRD